MKVDAIIGRDFINSNDFVGICIVREVDSSVEISEFDSGKVENTVEGKTNFDVSLMNEIIKTEESLFLEINDIELEVGDNLETSKCRREMEEIFVENYVKRKKGSEPLTKLEVDIKLKVNKYFNVRPRRFSHYERVELNKIIDEMLKKKIIRESESPYSSNVVLVRKKDGNIRMCINYRPLNRIVERNHYPLPVIEDQIEKLYGKKYFSSLDLKNGFYHVDLEEGSKKFTAFVTEDGHYEFNKLPFGYANSPSVFSRYICKVLREFIKHGSVVVFIDDILIATNTLEEHLDVLRKLLITLSDDHVELQLKKCQFLKTRIEYLGYNLEQNKMTLSDKHVKAIKDYPIPTDEKSLHRFVGLISYFRKFVLNFNYIAAPLYELLKSKNDFRFEGKHLECFNELRSRLISKPILRIYSQNSETQLHTDASAIGFGGILMQRQVDDNKFHPIMYFSRKTTSSEVKLHSFELETLAIVYSLQRFRTYLFGLRFTIITDWNALKMTLNKRDVNAKIERWSMFLEQFSFELIHRKNESMRHVDALSRVNVYIVESEDSNLFDETIHANQGLDQNIAKIKGKLLNEECKGYELRDGLVFKTEKQKLMLLVPENMTESVIYKYHNELGHFGVDKVCEMIRRVFYFTKMREKVLRHIKNCVTCIMYNPKQRIDRSLLKNIDKGNVPFFTLHVDHLGPLETTKGKNNYVLAIIDGFTKYIRLYATKTTNTVEIIKRFKSYILEYSTPERIITDRGSGFTSKQFETFVKSHNIIHTLNATACPQANGQIERYNRTLIPLLSKLVEEKNNFWDTLLVDAEFLLNNTLNRGINEVPAKLLYGVIQRRNIGQGLFEYLDSLNDEMLDREKLRETASNNIKQLQQYNKARHDMKCGKVQKYDEGNLVVIRNIPKAGDRKKLKRRFKGPYIVKKVLDNDRYVISDLDHLQISGKRFEGIFDPQNIRLWCEGNEQTEGESYSEFEIEYEEVEFLDEEF